MTIHTITKDQLDANNNYIGLVDLSKFNGNLEAEENLGAVKFKELKVNGHIHFKAGSGIQARYGITTSGSINSDGEIRAGTRIKADLSIVAGGGIEAGEGIEAGKGIRAGGRIKAGFGITARTISTDNRILAGIAGCRHLYLPKEHKEIRAKLVKGVIAHGTLIEPVEQVTLELTDQQLAQIKSILNQK